MAKSIGELFSKITANASQFIAEFARADNASRRAAASIDREVTKVTRSIKKKFSAGDIGKDVMRGLGIGSGFAVAQQAAEQIVNYYERAAEAAKEMEASTARQLDLTMQMVALRQTEAQEFAAAQKEEERLRKQLADFDAKDRTVTTGFDIVTGKVLKADPGLSEAEKAERGKLIEALQAQGLRVAQFQQKLADETADHERDVGRAVAEWNSRMRDASLKEAEDTADAKAAHEREVGEALSDWNTRMLEAAAKEAEDAADVERKLKFETMEATMEWQERMTQARIEDEQKVADAAAEMNDRLSGSMADVLLGVESLSDAFKALARDIARAWIQKNITDSIAGSITGSSIWKGIQAVTGFGGARADGGPVSAGSSYLVGEEGPEIFSPGRGGTIIPAGRTAAALSGGPSIVVKQTNHFASGVTREEVAGLLPRLIEASKQAVADQVMRGGGYRKAFG